MQPPHPTANSTLVWRPTYQTAVDEPHFMWRRARVCQTAPQSLRVGKIAVVSKNISVLCRTKQHASY